jgi:hypothetical protein
MPKKPIEYKTNVSVRITDSQKEIWESYAEANGFASISSLVRYATDELIESNTSPRSRKDNTSAIRTRLHEIEKKYNDLLHSQQEIIKLIAEKTPIRKENKPLREYQKGLIINLLQEKPRDELELQKILTDLSEVEILTLLNELMETSIIKQEGNKYAVI